MLWAEVRTTGDGGAAAFAPGLRNAVDVMGEVLRDLAAFREREVTMPAAVQAALAVGGTSGLPAEALTYADDAVLGLCTFNVGRIEGGRKINLVADSVPRRGRPAACRPGSSWPTCARSWMT